ncbi:MAG: glutamate--tRNA ligase family protein, partial [Candidatus Thorarchaeota archaeon]
FSWAIDDYLIGVSHVIRGIDLVKEGIIEEFIWDHFGWKKAKLLYHGRIKYRIGNTVLKLSKTDFRNKIQNGSYSGWEDPRTWSLQSLKKRGIKPEALRASLLDLGMSQSGISFSVNWLYSKNQDIIDEISDRYFFIENPINLIVRNVPSGKYLAEPLLLPSDPKKGRRKIHCKLINNQLNLIVEISDVKKFKEEKIVRLKDLLNIKIESIDLNKKDVKSSFVSKELNRDYPIIHWLPKDDNIEVSVMKSDGKISKGFGEVNLLKIPMNKTIQFERFGFVNPIELKEKRLFCYFTH